MRLPGAMLRGKERNTVSHARRRLGLKRLADEFGDNLSHRHVALARQLLGDMGQVVVEVQSGPHGFNIAHHASPILMRDPPGQLGTELRQFRVAAVVAGFLDQAFGLCEIAAGEVVVGQVEPHAGAGGDAEGFFEVVRRAAGEEGAGEIVELSSTANEVDGLVEVVSGFGGAGGVGAAERKVVEADVEEPSPLPVQGLGSPAEDFRSLALPEEQVAILIAPERVEGRGFGLALRLEPLGFREQAHRFDKVAGLMEGVGEGGAPAYPLSPLATAVGEIDRLPGCGDRFRYVAEGEMELADVVVMAGYAPPIRQLHGGFGCNLHRLDSIGQPTNGAEDEPSPADQQGLIGWREGGCGLSPRRLKKVGEQRKVGSESAKPPPQVELAATEYAVAVDLVERRLMPAGLAAVVDGMKKRRHLLERVGPVRSLHLVIPVEPRVALAGRLGREVRAHQRVAVDLVRGVLGQNEASVVEAFERG